MAESNHTQPSTLPSGDVEHHLTSLKLSFMAQQ